MFSQPEDYLHHVVEKRWRHTVEYRFGLGSPGPTSPTQPWSVSRKCATQGCNAHLSGNT